VNLDWIRELASSRPRIAAIVGFVSIVGAGAGAIANGSKVFDVFGPTREVSATESLDAGSLETIIAKAKVDAAAQVEAQAWTTAVQTNTIAGYDFYLDAFPKGFFRAQAREARTKLASATREGTPRPYDVRQLHPTVAPAVVAARNAAKEASARQTQAERAANMAFAAASQARAKARGYAVLRFRDRDTYEGEVAGGKANGLGVYVQGDRRFAGDRYQGQLSAGYWDGIGIFESSSGEAGRPARYGGEFVRGRLIGMGVIIRVDSTRQAGAVVDGVLTGYGVETRVDGQRIEGEFRNGVPEGLAVRWSADGRRVEEVGRFSAGRLTEPLAP